MAEENSAASEEVSAAAEHTNDQVDEPRVQATTRAATAEQLERLVAAFRQEQSASPAPQPLQRAPRRWPKPSARAASPR